REHAQAALALVVLTELLSDPKVSEPVKGLFMQLPMLEVADGFWQRAGLLRARLLARGRRARLADTLIAQACLDHDLPLVTRDSDFRHFVELAGVRLVVGSTRRRTRGGDGFAPERPWVGAHRAPRCRFARRPSSYAPWR